MSPENVFSAKICPVPSQNHFLHVICAIVSHAILYFSDCFVAKKNAGSYLLIREIERFIYTRKALIIILLYLCFIHLGGFLYFLFPWSLKNLRTCTRTTFCWKAKKTSLLTRCISFLSLEKLIPAFSLNVLNVFFYYLFMQKKSEQ